MYRIFTYILHKDQLNVGNVGKYTSPMDPMGIQTTFPVPQASLQVTKNTAVVCYHHHPSLSTWATPKTPMGLGILIMAYYNPYISG